MLERMAHRGPDGEGIEADSRVALGHRRLAIIDPSEAGRQPMTDPQRRAWLAVNGMIYNYRELQGEARAAGYPLRSSCDSEVILPQYLERGPECVTRLNGMWGLALWDTRTRTLMLSRDRVGVKPLYWTRARSHVFFASEVTALLAVLPGPVEHDLEYLARICRWGVDDPNGTPIKNVHAVPPGCNVLIDANGAVETRRYWTWDAPRDDDAKLTNEREVVRELRSLLTAAVERRMQSDAPVAYFLSGGLDSGSVVGIASGRSEEPLETVSSVYDLEGYDERRYIEDYVAAYGTRATFIQPTPDGALVDQLREIVPFLGGPVAGQGSYTEWWLFRAASRDLGAKVVLSGNGGDEVLAGYHPYLRGYLASLARDYADHRRARDLARLVWDAYRYRRVLGKSYIFNDAIAAFHGKGRDRMRAFRSWLERGIDKPAPAPRWLAPAMQDAAERARPDPARTIEEQIRAGLLLTIMPGLLRIEDRMGMAASVEARHPFLDVNLIDYLKRVDYRLKVRGLSTKNLLRKAMKGIMPERPRKRRDKMGLPTPVARWLRTTDRDSARDYLRATARRHPDVLDGPGLERLFEQHLDEQRDNSKALYTALTTGLWLDYVARLSASDGYLRSSIIAQ